jgi:N-methylhydantoinase B
VTTRIDPITFQLIRNGLEATVDEMALTIARTAYSTVVRESLDYSTGFLDKNGQLMAQGLSIAVHLGAMPSALASVMREYRETMQPGDIYVINDPYDGAAHLQDIFMFKPIFYKGDLTGFAAAIAHETDIGGRVPGSNAADSTEIYQEGLRIPPLPLFLAGKPNRTLFDIISHNVRVSEKVLGDIRAQTAACFVGEQRFLEILERYGAETTMAYMDELIDFSERMTRDEIRALPDGVYSFVDHLDEDGMDPDPIPIAVTLTIADDEITVDLTGSAQQVRGALNSPLPSTHAAVYASIRCMFSPELPSNAGIFKPIHIIAPEGTIVNPVHPASVAARGVTLYRIGDAVFGALSQAVPDRVPAAADGGPDGIIIGGYDEHRKGYMHFDVHINSSGGHPLHDGMDGITSFFGNIANTPIEMLELAAPIRIERYELVPDSGGAGLHRGGLAAVKDVRFLGKEAVLQSRTDRRVFQPYGLHGGKPGAASNCCMNPGPNERSVPSKPTMPIRFDEVFSHVTAGSGGWGDPLQRNLTAIARDLRLGKITPEGARRNYGVVLDENDHVDEIQTMALRAELAATRGQTITAVR